MKRIWNFLELDYNDKFLEYDKTDMHILGNRMRNTYSGIIIGDESWRNQMKEKEISSLNKLLEHELERFGFTSFQ